MRKDVGISTIRQTILSPHILNLPAMLEVLAEVLAIEPLAAALQSRGDDERVIPRPAVSVCDRQTFKIKGGSRMLSQQRAEHGREVPLGLGHAHRFSKPPERNIEEFFNHLVACDSLKSYRLSSTPKSKLRHYPRPTLLPFTLTSGIIRVCFDLTGLFRDKDILLC
jgi:hypothetical protein